MPNRQHQTADALPWHWLTRLAFLITLCSVVARLMLSEAIRSPSQPLPGDQAGPLGPGPATSLALDLLAMLPVLLVLARRSLDSQYKLRFSLSAIAFLALGGLAFASTLWSADKFAAVVSSLNWLASMALLWSASQLANSPKRLRIVAGLCVGMLLVLVVAGYYYRFIEWPDLRNAWQNSKAEIIREHNWSADSFNARQFEIRIFSGDVMGFSTSPNTYAALIVLLGLVTAGVGMQRFYDGDGSGWIAAAAIPIGLALPCLRWAESKGAGATAVLGGILLAVLPGILPKLQANSRRIFRYSWLGFGLATLAVVGHGMYHHSLVLSSLTFRWEYWVGSVRLIAAHPLAGVGFENFGPAYLAFRLPIAGEEIRDPHNFIIRFVAELGLAGGLILAVAIVSLAWESTQLPPIGSGPKIDDPDWLPRRERSEATARLLCFSILAILINIAASIDFTSSTAYVVIELMRRSLFLLCLLGGLAIASIRIPVAGQRFLRETDVEFYSDHRDATWMRYGLLVGLLLFLIHNLIDFALFEPGPSFLFALLAGTCIGTRKAESRTLPAPRLLSGFATAIGLLAWLSIAAMIFTPIASAESAAHEADDAIRANQPSRAAAQLEEAFKLVPYNGDYALRAAQLLVDLHDPRKAYSLLSQSIAVDPSLTRARVWRASVGSMLPDIPRQTNLNDLATAVSLDPQSVYLHQLYAESLRRSGQLDLARRQYQLALEANNGLASDNPKRLSKEDLKALKQLAGQP